MRTYSLEEDVVDEALKTAAMVGQHNDFAGCESTIPCLMPLSFEQFRKVTLPHSVFQTYTWQNLSKFIGTIPHDSTLTHYFVEK